MRGVSGEGRRRWRCKGGSRGGGAPISTVEDGGRADVEKYNGITRAEVVLDGPFDSECAFIAEVYGNGNATVSGGGEGGGGGSAGGSWGGERDREGWGGGWWLDLDGWEVADRMVSEFRLVVVKVLVVVVFLWIHEGGGRSSLDGFSLLT